MRVKDLLLVTLAVSEKVHVGAEIPGGGGRGRLYLTLLCHHQNHSCVKMGSDESHFNVSLIVRAWSQDNFQEKGEPKRNRTKVPLFTSLTPSAHKE